MTPFFNPGPIRNPDVPIYIAGVGPYLSRLAGGLCSGFHVHPFHTVRYLDEVVLPGIAAGSGTAGRTIHDVELATTVFVMTGATESEVEQAMAPVRQQIAFYARHLRICQCWRRRAGTSAVSSTRWPNRAVGREMARLVPDEAVLTVGVAATADRLAEAIRDRYGDRVQRLGFYTIGSTLDTDPEALREVIRRLQGRHLQPYSASPAGK